MKNLLTRIKNDERGEGSIYFMWWTLWTLLGIGLFGGLAVLAATGVIG